MEVSADIERVCASSERERERERGGGGEREDGQRPAAFKNGVSGGKLEKDIKTRPVFFTLSRSVSVFIRTPARGLILSSFFFYR